MSLAPARVRAGRRALLPLLACLLWAASADAAEELLLGVTLNEVEKGVFFAYRETDGDLLFSEKDLRAMGFRLLTGEPRLLAGEPHRSLTALVGAGFAFDPGAVAVRITAPPELLEKKVIDFLVDPSAEVEHPAGRSAFLNYRLSYQDESDADYSRFDAVGEFGARSGDLLFVSSGTYRREEGEDTLLRLMTSASWEDRQTLRRLTLGDETAASGDLWSSRSLTGISLSKVPRMDPYLVQHPTFGYAGVAALPSELRVYLDGVLIRTEQLAPGEFELRNLDSYGGDRRVEVVVRDAFGRETRLSRPFYFTDAVLRRGYQEYSYHAGWVREDYGEASNRYGPGALFGYHRYGLTDAFTIGLAAEAGSVGFSGGPLLSFVIGSFGTVSIAASGGRMDGSGEFAGLLAHEYEGTHLSTRLRFMHTTSGYRRLFDEESEEDRNNAFLDAEVGYGATPFGSLVLAYRAEWEGPGEERSRVSADYRLGLFGKVSFFATVGHSREGNEDSTDIFTGFSWFPGRELTAAAQFSHREGTDQVTLDVSQDRSGAEGLAWRAAAQWQDGDRSLRPAAEYYGPHGILGGSLTLRPDEDAGGESGFAISAAGSLLAAGGRVGLARPVQDSFALVKVGTGAGVPGVRVYQGGIAQGVTDRDGVLFVPEVSSYVYNTLSIEPEDIPLGLSIDRVERVISPAARSGSVVSFEAARYQAVTGRLRVREDGAFSPMEYLEIVVEAGGRRWSVPSGGNGEFFLENVGSGFVSLSFRDRGRDRSCVIDVPESEELIVDIGEVSCEFFP